MNSYEKKIDTAIAGLNAVKLAYDTYATTTPAHEIIDRVCAALEQHGQLGKYVAEGIRQERMAPAHQRPPAGSSAKAGP